MTNDLPLELEHAEGGAYAMLETGAHLAALLPIIGWGGPCADDHPHSEMVGYVPDPSDPQGARCAEGQAHFAGYRTPTRFGWN